MASLLTGTNPVLTRELRASLRNVRSFVLLAVYVAVLGAVAVNAFPQTIIIERGGAEAGRNLFWQFTGWQALMVLVLLPALATGALAQEREQRTLEPLLLTPLTPMQIVWGKAAGVLSLAGLLLLSTLPLTSLCFLLGGVSPGEVIAAYSLLLGLAAFTAGIGLYCSAWQPTAMRALVACYLTLPVATGFLAIFAVFAAPVVGLFLLGLMVYALASLWKRWAQAPLIGHFRVGWWVLFWILVFFLLCIVAFIMVSSRGLGVAGLAIIFGMPYLFITAHYAMQQAAREIARNPDPAPALRERMETIHEDWQRAVAPPPTVYLPSPTGPYTYTAQVAPRPRKPRPATYGKQPFLPDHLNPVYAKDMRGGLVGKLDYLFRFSYIVTIGTELLLPIALLSDVNASAIVWFGGWANLHLMLLLTIGAWLGARTIAPEREQQTLPQLLMAPLLPTEIVRGKMMAAMVYTFYVFMLSLPLALLLPLLGEMAWRTTFGFIAAEVVLGAFAAAWGIYCSMLCSTVRRAIGCALGGILFLVLSGSFFDILFASSYGVVLSPVADFVLGVIENVRRLLPFDVLHEVLPSRGSYSGPGGMTNTAALLPQAILLYGGATLLLLSLTSRAFRRYARTV